LHEPVADIGCASVEEKGSGRRSILPQPRFVLAQRRGEPLVDDQSFGKIDRWLYKIVPAKRTKSLMRGPHARYRTWNAGGEMADQ